MLFWILILCGYILGSIPFGLFIGKARGIDLRKVGSGNIGATNVQRTLGWTWAGFSFILDFAKGAVPVIIALILGLDKWQAAAIGASVVIGHCWSVFLLFKGGKGISTTFAVIVTLDWRIGLGALVLWIIILLLYRYVSLASIIGAAMLPFGFYIVTFDLPLSCIILLISLVTILRHYENIKRLKNGNENKIGQKVLPNAG
jgi:glycerol-3-phosphate acyltransferase PlsY